jgi:hypothetical protein
MTDVWADEDDDEYERGLSNRNWEQLQEKMGTLGYTKGVNDAKEIHLQSGFDNGYKKAAEIALEIGKMQGRLSTIISTSKTEDLEMIEFYKILETVDFNIFDGERQNLELQALTARFKTFVPDTIYT